MSHSYLNFNMKPYIQTSLWYSLERPNDIICTENVTYLPQIQHETIYTDMLFRPEITKKRHLNANMTSNDVSLLGPDIL